MTPYTKKIKIWTKNNYFHSFFFIADQVQSFLGNQTHKDYFKLLQTDGVSLLIGARNVVYNLSLADLTENVDRVSHFHKEKKILFLMPRKK